jgi:hypothetical protein
MWHLLQTQASFFLRYGRFAMGRIPDKSFVSEGMQKSD